MTLDPRSLIEDLDILEQIEKATLRMVTQAIYDFRNVLHMGWLIDCVSYA